MWDKNYKNIGALTKQDYTASGETKSVRLYFHKLYRRHTAPV